MMKVSIEMHHTLIVPAPGHNARFHSTQPVSGIAHGESARDRSFWTSQAWAIMADCAPREVGFRRAGRIRMTINHQHSADESRLMRS